MYRRDVCPGLRKQRSWLGWEKEVEKAPRPGTAYGNPGGGDRKDEWGATAGRAALRRLDKVATSVFFLKVRGFFGVFFLMFV